ncbi:hypothetical protein PybrP1_012755 [[Pythium] brassicae (nom. inval.)]|nr:hypothetical protein PybrP1_012755 [[Pythium] brassicae (nom. inval.)]
MLAQMQVAQWLPERRLLAAATALGYLCYYVLRFRRSVVDARVAAAFSGRASPAEQRRIARDAYVYLSLSLLWFLRLPTVDPARVREELVDVDAADVDAFHERVVAARHNAILLTGHVGMWELLPAALADPLCEQWIVYRPLHQAALDRIVTDIRQAPRRHLVPGRLQDSSSTAQLVGLVADHRASSRRGAPRAEVTFLRQRTLLPTGAARLHLGSAGASSLWVGALVHNTAFYRSPPVASCAKPFKLVLREIAVPLVSSEDPQADDNAAAITQSYAQALEEVVLQHPEQYLWLHDLWSASRRS